MTTFVLVSIAFSVIATLLLIVRRTTGRATASVDLNGMIVSRQWLTQHQSNDQA
jgi:hypothetical protein